jgi:hypothetical protein
MSEQPFNSVDEGARLLQAGELDRSLELLAGAVTMEPQNVRALTLLGLCQARRGEHAAAAAAMAEAARLQPQDAGAQYNLAVALFQNAQLEAARAAAERAVALNPEHTAARQLLERIGAAPSASEEAAPPEAAPPAWAAPSAAGTEPPADASFPRGFPAPEARPFPPAEPPPGPGMVYTPQAGSEQSGEAPSLGKRLVRGLLWGALMGQWWTLWMMFWTVVWNFSRLSQPLILIFAAIVFCVIFGFAGSLLGLIIGGTNAGPELAAGVGVAAGLLLCGLEAVLARGSWYNVFFYFFTGRYIGGLIWTKVHQPVFR